MTSAIQIQQVHKRFGAVQALSGIDLEVALGEFFGLLGPNGAGKTTAFNMISGLYTPSSGAIILDGQDIAGLARTDPVLAATVLECSRKPPAPVGQAGFDAFGHVPEVHLPEQDAWYALLYLGRRDCEPGGLRPLLAGATSDVSVLVTPEPLRPGAVVEFAADYEALVRAVTSPYVAVEYVRDASAAEGDI